MSAHNISSTDDNDFRKDTPLALVAAYALVERGADTGIALGVTVPEPGADTEVDKTIGVSEGVNTPNGCVAVYLCLT